MRQAAMGVTVKSNVLIPRMPWADYCQLTLVTSSEKIQILLCSWMEVTILKTVKSHIIVKHEKKKGKGKRKIDFYTKRINLVDFLFFI